jgi:hypothetical protein
MSAAWPCPPPPEPPRVASSPEAALGDWGGDGAIALAIPDATRPLDPTAALRALRARLPQLGPVLVGLGLHRPLFAAERAALLAACRAAGIDEDSLIEHNPDVCVSLGERAGLPALVHPAVADAPATLALGVCELHQYAGVSGGHKAVAVGLGGRATIAGLHARARVLADGVRIGQLAGNPFREAIDQLGEAARCRWALLCAATPEGPRWIFGEPRAAVRAGLALLDAFEPTDAIYDEAVLVVPAAKASSLYQASRAATYLGLSPAPPLRPGAPITIEAAMPEGLGAEAGFCAALQASRGDWSRLLTGPEPTGAGAQRAVMLALLAALHPLRLRGLADPGPLRALGFDAEAGPATPGPRALRVPEPFSRLPQRRG